MKHYVNPKFIPQNYQQCSKTVMDNISDLNISFDKNGICNYYYEYLEEEKKSVKKGSEGQIIFNSIIEKIKVKGKGRKYDCILGVSGGVDSTYLAYIAKQNGLRVLCVHFDNGWNSKLAVKNIENMTTKLKYDLETFIISWEEFKDMQLAYLRANVPDIEVITDHAIFGTIYKIAAKNKINFILSGSNVVTEHLLPKYWRFNKSDYINIRDIHKKYGTHSLNTYPFFGKKERYLYQNLKKINSVNLLNYIDYNKDRVKSEIVEKLNWQDYGHKHYESIFTRFYQGYILPNKFGIDKRKAHLSNLICSGQITRQTALEELQKPIYDEHQCKEDMQFVLEKLGFSKLEFSKYIDAPRQEHTKFKTEKSIYNRYPILRLLKPIGNLLKKI